MFPEKEIKFVGKLLLAFIILTILKGGKQVKSLIGLTPCSFPYQLFNLGMVALAYLVAKDKAQSIAEVEDKKELEGYDFKKYGKKLDSFIL